MIYYILIMIFFLIMNFDNDNLRNVQFIFIVSMLSTVLSLIDYDRFL